MQGHAIRSLILGFCVVLTFCAAAAAGTVSGTLEYEDKVFDGDETPPYQGTRLLPIRGAHVEIRQVSNGEVLGTATTDDTGAYSVTVTDVGTVDAALQCYAWLSAEAVFVVGSGGGTHVMEVDLTNLDTSGTVSGEDFVADIAGGGAGPFNILDCIHSGYDYIDAVAAGAVPTLTVNWDANMSWGTYYWPEQDEMYLQSSRSGGDPDEFDDGVILHEFGHVVAFELAADDSPGGAHTLSGRYDPRLTWSEGWATFYSCVVRDNRYYMDSIDGGDLAIKLDIEDLSAFPQGTEIDNEVAVSGVLWDIVDGGTGEAFDSLEADFGTSVWDVMENHFTLAVPLPRTLETFWDGWFARGHGSASYMEAIFRARGIEFYEDDEEDDGGSAVAKSVSTGTATHHTLYPVSDEDWAELDAQPGRLYVVKTTNLANAGDTVLELFRPEEESAAALHDDRSATDLSSAIAFNPAAAGTYLVRVTPYEGPDQLVRYGSYDLEVSYTTATLPRVENLNANESGGTYSVSWTYPPGVYDGIVVAYGDDEIPSIEYLQGSFNVINGTGLYAGRSATGATLPSGGAAHLRFAAWTYRDDGYISEAVTIGRSGGGGGCFVTTAAGDMSLE